MMSALRYLTAHCWPGKIHLLFCVKTPDDIIFHDEIQRLERQFENVHTYISVTQPGDGSWTGPTGRLTAEVIKSVVPDIAAYAVHICGPQAMMDASKAALLSLAVPEVKIKTEAFGTDAKRSRASAPEEMDSSKAVAYNVQFSRSNQTVAITSNQTVLDAADAAGVSIDQSCLAGTCGTCIVKLASGEVDMAVDDALEPQEKSAGYILACQAKPKSNVTIDA